MPNFMQRINGLRLIIKNPKMPSKWPTKLKRSASMRMTVTAVMTQTLVEVLGQVVTGG
jgi:hypothetical protein